MENVEFTFDHKQQVFAQLITKTMGNPHGRFPLQQEDDGGMVWEFQMPMSQTLAWRLLWEASGGDLTTPAGERMGEERRASILPQNNSYVIFSGDNDYIWSLYQSQGRYYIMRAKGRRYFDLLLRGRFAKSDADAAVYEALRQLYHE